MTPAHPLQNKNFRAYLIYLFFFSMGFQIQFVVASFEIYNLTKDPLSLGYIGLAEIVPFLLVCLFGGHVSDVFNRKTIGIYFSLLHFCVSCSYYIVFSAHYTPEKIITAFYFFTFLGGFCRGFTRPAFSALLVDIVPPEFFAQASALRAGSWQTSSIIGPAIAGFMIAYFGSRNTFLISSSMMCLGLISIFFIKNVHVKKFKMETSIFKSLKEGISFVFSKQLMLAALSLDMFSVLFGGATALIPVFALDILQVGPKGLGIMKAAPGIGAILMLAILARFPIQRKTGKILLLAVGIFGLSFLGFGLSTNFYLSLFCLFMTGLTDSVSIVIRQTLVQTLTPKEMMGRVSSVNSIFISSSNEFGSFESGLAAKFMGTVPSVIFGSCMTIFIVLATAFKAPQLRKLDRI